MNNGLLHIGLQITEKDLYPFYVDLLHGEIIKTFKLNRDIANCIFSKDKETVVYEVAYKWFTLELFIDHKSIKTFSHLCIQSEDANKNALQAIEKGYPIFLRKSENNSKTYFIRDTNENLFEIKQTIVKMIL